MKFLLAFPLFSLLLALIWGPYYTEILCGVVFAFFVFFTRRNPVASFLLVLASLGWWEVPIMRLRFPNQFLCEICMLGFLVGIWPKLGSREKKNFVYEQHPLFFPLFFISMVIFFQFVVSIPQLISFSYSAMPVQKILQVLGRNLFLWRIAESPIHSLSVMNGYLIQLAFLSVMPSFIRKKRISESTLCLTFVCGSFPVFLYALGQKLTWIPIVASVGIGGTFQNQNSLSFYAGLMLLVASLLGARWILQRSYKRSLWILLYSFVCMYFLLLGQSRISSFSCLCSVAIFFFFECLFHRENKKYVKNIISVVVSLFSSAVVLFFFLKMHQSGKFEELKNLIHRGSFLDLLEGGGRHALLQEAWKAAFLSPFTGIGYGYFFNKSGLDEVHNQMLEWIVSVGWGILPLCLFFFFRPFYLLGKERKKLSSLFSFFIALNIYILGTSLFDHYFSYRTLLAASLFLLLLPFLSLSVSTPARKIFYALGALAFLLAFVRIPNPQSHPLPTAAWGATSEEVALHGEFRWNGPAFLQPMEKSCVLLSVYPKHEGGKSSLHVGWLGADSKPSVFSTLTEYLKLASAPQVEMENGKWNHLCFCQKPGPSRLLLLMAEKGEYQTLSGQSTERRKDFFISYGITQPQPFEWEKEPEIAKKCIAGRIEE